MAPTMISRAAAPRPSLVLDPVTARPVEVGAPGGLESPGGTGIVPSGAGTGTELVVVEPGAVEVVELLVVVEVVEAPPEVLGEVGGVLAVVVVAGTVVAGGMVVVAGTVVVVGGTASEKVSVMITEATPPEGMVTV